MHCQGQSFTDRGYFCKENICFMDDNGYDFVIMVKGMKSLVRDLVLEVQGSFENDRGNSIRAFKVSGTTIKGKLYATDKKERYFHITQKTILKAFGMTADNIHRQARALGSDLMRIETDDRLPKKKTKKDDTG